jgi:hypothetical protein
MNRNIYKAIAFERFTGKKISTSAPFTTVANVEKAAKELLHYSNVERVDVLKNGCLFEFFGKENGARHGLKVKDGKVTTVRL